MSQQRRRLHGRIGLEGPQFVSRGKLQRMNRLVVGADKDLAPADDGGRFDWAARFESPQQAGLGGQRAGGHASQGGIAAKNRPPYALTEAPRQHTIKMMPPLNTTPHARLSATCIIRLFRNRQVTAGRDAALRRPDGAARRPYLSQPAATDRLRLF